VPSTVTRDAPVDVRAGGDWGRAVGTLARTSKGSMVVNVFFGRNIRFYLLLCK